MAKKIAAELDCDIAAIFTPGNDTYTVDTAIKEDLVKKKLEAAWDKANGTAEESKEPVESSEADESSEAVESSEDSSEDSAE